MRRVLKVLALLAASSGWISSPALAACPVGADPAKWVDGGGTCLALSVAGTEAAGSKPTLVVLIHGDVSAGGPANYMYPLAQSLKKPGIVVAALLRPGYADDTGATSQGSHYGRRDSYTPVNVTAVGQAVAKLRARYDASRVVVVGHSGGAAITGVLAGRQPGLFNAAVLVSCPCDIASWRRDRNRGAWPNSLSPHAFVAGVPKSTSIIAITGGSDDRTPPSLARNYVAALTARGINARAEVVPGASHAFRSLEPAVTAAVRKLAGS
jgi:pimeloyl-ACP methyl ester carboxylesterase